MAMHANKVKYTLDRIEEGQYVFLEHPKEENQLLIPTTEINTEIAEGSIVLIRNAESGYEVELLIKETEDMQVKVRSLLEKLNSKN